MAGAFQDFDVYHTLGLPWHGLETSGFIALPNGTQKEAPSASGPSLAVKHPAAPGITRTPEEAAQDADEGKEWRNYALLSGDQRYIGGSQLSANPASGEFIYIDPAGTPWVLRAGFEISGAPTGGLQSREMVVILKALFGRVQEDALPAIDRELFRETYTFVDPPAPAWDPDDYDDWRTYAVPNSDGTRVIVNVYSLPGPYIDSNSGRPTNAVVRDIDEYAISGTGSTDPATLGDGITATRLSRDHWPQSPEVLTETQVAQTRWCGKDFFTITGTAGVDEKKVREFEQVAGPTKNKQERESEWCYGAIYVNDVKSLVKVWKKTTSVDTIDTYGPGKYICYDQGGGPTGPDPLNWPDAKTTCTFTSITEWAVSGGSLSWVNTHGAPGSYDIAAGAPGSSACCDEDIDGNPAGTPCAVWNPDDYSDAFGQYYGEGGLEGDNGAPWAAPEVAVQGMNGAALLTVEKERQSAIFSVYLGGSAGQYLVGTDFDQNDIPPPLSGLRVALNPETGETAYSIDGSPVAYF